MEWIKAHQKLISWILVGIGAVLLIAGIAFFIIDAKLQAEAGMNADAINSILKALRGIMGTSTKSAISDGLGGGAFGSSVGDIASNYTVNLYDRAVDEALSKMPEGDRIMIKGFMFLLPFIPKKLLYTLLGIVLVGLGLFGALILPRNPAMVSGIASFVKTGRGGSTRFSWPKKSPGAPAGASVTHSTAARCPACGSAMFPEARFCPSCGAPAAVSRPAPSAFCPACGNPLPMGAASCPRCGQALRSSMPRPEAGAVYRAPTSAPAPTYAPAPAPKAENRWIHKPDDL